MEEGRGKVVTSIILASVMPECPKCFAYLLSLFVFVKMIPIFVDQPSGGTHPYTQLLMLRTCGRAFGVIHRSCPFVSSFV